MPHVILEYSNNLKTNIDYQNFFEELHALLANQLPTQITSCKSRAYSSENYCIGESNEQDSFIHLTIKILAGRSKECKEQVGLNALAMLQRYLTNGSQKVNFSVEILDLSESYFKT